MLIRPFTSSVIFEFMVPWQTLLFIVNKCNEQVEISLSQQENVITPPNSQKQSPQENVENTEAEEICSEMEVTENTTESHAEGLALQKCPDPDDESSDTSREIMISKKSTPPLPPSSTGGRKPFSSKRKRGRNSPSPSSQPKR